jgi:hypothetical protein
MTATVARPALSACLELLKPVTWFAPMWAFSCGVVSSGLGGNGRWHLIGAGTGHLFSDLLPPASPPAKPKLTPE